MQKLHAKVTLHHLVLTYRESKRKETLNKSFNTIPEFGKGQLLGNWAQKFHVAIDLQKCYC